MLVRLFAGAADAAGTDQVTLPEPPATYEALAEAVIRACPGADAGRLATVLSRCTALAAGTAVRPGQRMPDGADEVDVLPPFAGG